MVGWLIGKVAPFSLIMGKGVTVIEEIILAGYLVTAVGTRFSEGAAFQLIAS